MLAALHISNYALIDSIDIEFSDGLNIITGETGAGKSIILGALGLLLGGRADSRVIADKAKKSVIEATFIVKDNAAVKQFCIDNDIDCDDDSCIVRREVTATGRTRSFINDTPVTLNHLSQLGLLLIDIHSQHQNQLLSTPEFQLRIIDSIADNHQLFDQYTQAYNVYRATLNKYKTAKASIMRDRDNADFMEFQLSQLRDLDLHDGELADLTQRRDEMSHSTQIKSYLAEAREAISESRDNAITQVDRVKEAIVEIDNIFPADDQIIQRLESVAIELSDIAQTITAIDARYDCSPADLEYIDNRIADIQSMMHKHHVETDTELLSLQSKLSKRLQLLEDSDNILSQLQQRAKAAKQQVMTLAQQLSASRTAAAKQFAQQLQQTAMPLGMKNIVCEIPVTTGDMTPTGIDTVEFLFAFNKNQDPIPVSGAASGGEISRLMLSIKAIIADKIQLPTIIFDEVDTGVSGDVAQRMGHMMADMSSRLQVIAITHLPQVAALGQLHLKVYKEDDELSTHTYIKSLNDSQRIDELALMLSGDPSNPAARANAQSLLNDTPH